MKKKCERCGQMYDTEFRPRLTVWEDEEHKIEMCRECTVVLTAWMGKRRKNGDQE